jgi:hypothetical protein
VTWFAFKGYPTISLAGIQEKQAVSLGFHGYATMAQAVQHPNSVNVLQKVTLNILEADYKQALKGGQQPGGPDSNLANPANDIGAAANLAGVGAIGDFFNRITEPNTWLRVGEVVVGLLILYIGLKATTAQTPVGNAVKSAAAPAKKAAKFARAA